MDSSKKAVALKIVVALGLGTVAHVVEPGTASADGVYTGDNQPSTPEQNGGGSGSGSGSSVLYGMTVTSL